MVASYPGGLKVFTSKVNIQDIVDAVDVNELQEEVAAIQAELSTSPSGASATVAARFTAVEGVANGHRLRHAAGGVDEITPGDIGAAVFNHGHDTTHNHDLTYAAYGHNHDATYLNTAGDTLTGPLSFDNNIGRNPQLEGYRETVVTLPTSGTVTLNLAAANIFDLSPTGAVTLAFTNTPPAGTWTSATLRITNSSHAITWPTGTLYPDGRPPVLDGETWLSLVLVGTTARVGVAWAAVA